MFSCVWAWSDDNGGHRQQHGGSREGSLPQMCCHPLVRLQGEDDHADYGDDADEEGVRCHPFVHLQGEDCQVPACLTCCPGCVGAH